VIAAEAEGFPFLISLKILQFHSTKIKKRFR
jgi:hypothetical protein